MIYIIYQVTTSGYTLCTAHSHFAHKFVIIFCVDDTFMYSFTQFDSIFCLFFGSLELRELWDSFFSSCWEFSVLYW